MLKETIELADSFVTMSQEPQHPGKLLDWIVLSNLLWGNYAPMQVIKQLEHGRTSTTDEQKQSSFHTNYHEYPITPRVLQTGVSQ